MRLVRSIGFDNQTEDTTLRSSTKASPAPGQVLSISTVCTRTDDLDMANVAMMKAILTAGLYPQVSVLCIRLCGYAFGYFVCFLSFLLSHVF